MIDVFERIYIETVESTNDMAKTLAKRKQEDFLIVSYEQTRGRGQQDREWFCAPGKSLAITYCLLRPKREWHQHMTKWTALAVCRLLEELDIPAKIKAPNDILVEGKKIAGILCEAEFIGQDLQYIVIGIGLNVNQEHSDFPEELQGLTHSLKSVTQQEWSLEGIERRLTYLMVNLLGEKDKSKYTAEYERTLIAKGESIYESGKNN